MKNWKIWRKELPLYVVATILSALNTVLYNIPFLQFVFSHANMEGWRRTTLIVSMVLLLLLLNFCVFYLLIFLLRKAGRIVMALFSVLSALATYYIITYNTMMDESMLGNVFNTRYSEASGFITFDMLLWVLAMGMLPAIWIIVQRINYGKWRTFGRWFGGGILASILIVLINLNQVLWIGKYDTELGGLVMPWSYTVNSLRLWAHHLDKQQEEKPLPDATIDNNERSALVLVIGESARRANFSLYGYQRITNPQLQQIEGLHVFEAVSCATYTTAGTKSILEYTTTNDLYEILPNYLYRTGVDVVWRTSNWGEPPVHIDEYIERKTLAKQQEVEGDVLDEVLFHGIKERINKSNNDKVLIILHTSTSHGPDYQRQYPPQFEQFTPVCSTVEEAEKDRNRLVNAYDNSILYTDWLLSTLINDLKTITDRHCAMIYVSDHGESLGENGLFMHGVPMKLAPREQYEIPFLVWTDGTYRTVKTPKETIDQHYVFHSVIRWLGINSPIYNDSTSLFE
ncbi:MAG: phosphoethanolamine--lipid A transferase EptA [Bacteroidales bacterium]|nr:phosphoethanolamine--lipid A transferase EptA [Bacteroidales bacterium]